MITRYWRGITFHEKADAYEAHLRQETFKKLETIDGFRGAQILKRTVPEGIEFVVLSNWESMDVIKSFAGEDIENAVVPDVARAMMVSFDERVVHYSS